jgi:membrane-bound ClpP family serine protease
MIILGIVLLVAGWLLAIQILWVIGVICLVIGLIMLCLGFAGHAVGGRRHWY